MLLTTESKTAVIQLLSDQQAWHYQIFPLGIVDHTLHLQYHQDSSSEIATELEILLGRNIQLHPTSEKELFENIAKHYRKPGPAKTDSETISIDQEGRKKDILSSILEQAQKLDSSDIHIETYENTCRIRLRIDGKLIERYVIGKDEYPSLVNKIKISANLDIAEKRLPQDGRILINSKGRKIDIRTSIVPTLYGEKIVLRLLNNQDINNIALETLGFSDQELANYLEGIKNPNGIVLISGPTGSGKTTTLYATLSKLNKVGSNIMTIEDPIEYTLEGINQVQLKPSIGLDFPSAMRTFLRQDPDIIMLGEIRDKETAVMAIRASLTGHLVFSTIHTNSAWGIVSRLTDMDIPPYLLADTLNTAVAQRLVRKLCKHCAEPTSLKRDDFPGSFVRPKDSANRFFKAKGCEQCHYTGYQGRVAVYEVIPMDRTMKSHIRQGVQEVQGYLKEQDIRTLGDNAYALLKSGITTIDEVYPLLR